MLKAAELALNIANANVGIATTAEYVSRFADYCTAVVLIHFKASNWFNMSRIIIWYGIG
jgi:hypothetical protein